jgi:hypothetical protein
MTWMVALELIATRRLPTARIDTSARLIVTSPIAVHPIDADRWAACGYMTDPASGRIQFLADRAEFSMLVRPLGDSSIVLVAATWMTGAHGGGECESRHAWELGLEGAIKATAERRYTVLRHRKH